MNDWYCAWGGAYRDFMVAAQQAADTTGITQKVHVHHKHWTDTVEETVRDDAGEVIIVRVVTVLEDTSRVMACAVKLCREVKPNPKRWAALGSKVLERS